jgi:hypothetical protein
VKLERGCPGDRDIDDAEESERYWKKRVPSPLKDSDSPRFELHPHFK